MGRKVGTVLSFITILLELFTALFLTPFIIRSFGQAEYGVYSLVLSITSYLTLLDMGVGNSVTRFMSKYRATGEYGEQRRFLGITTVYYVAIAIIVLLVGAAIIAVFPVAFSKGLTPSEVELAKNLLVITTLNVSITIGTSGFFYTVISYENFTVSKGVAILGTVARIIASFIALSCGAKSVGIVAINTITGFITRLIVVLYVLLRMKLRPTLKNIRFSQIREIVAYSAIIFLQMIATQINSMADQILIGMFTVASSGILAVYGVGSLIGQYFQIIGSALNGTLMPGVVKTVETDGTAKTLQREMTRIGRLNFAFIGIIWVTILVFGEQFVILWSGPENAEAYIVALLLSFPFIFILTQSIGTQILWAKNKHKTQAYLKLGIVLLNVVLTIFLIRWNPLLGATIGTFISLMLGDVLVMQIVFKKDIGIKLSEYYRNLFKGILPSLLISLVIGFLIRYVGLSGWIGLGVNCSVMTASYLVCMMCFGFNNDEKLMIRKMKAKIICKKR